MGSPESTSVILADKLCDVLVPLDENDSAVLDYPIARSYSEIRD